MNRASIGNSACYHSNCHLIRALGVCVDRVGMGSRRVARLAGWAQVVLTRGLGGCLCCPFQIACMNRARVEHLFQNQLNCLNECPDTPKRQCHHTHRHLPCIQEVWVPACVEANQDSVVVALFGGLTADRWTVLAGGVGDGMADRGCMGEERQRQCRQLSGCE